MSLGAVRRKQVIAAAISLLIALLWVILRIASDKPLSTMIALLICVSAFTYGGWYVKWSLESKTSQRISAIETQLPAVLDLLAFAISAGEPALLAIRRVTETCSGPLTRELKKVVNSIDSGESLARSLNNLSSDLDSQALSRAFHALTLALERGTPLAQVLRAQAADARAQQARLLLVLAGRKETAMMLPVVFLILPMIVAVALYPGIVALQVL
jgi:tight adherence protein C